MLCCVCSATFCIIRFPFRFFSSERATENFSDLAKYFSIESSANYSTYRKFRGFTFFLFFFVAKLFSSDVSTRAFSPFLQAVEKRPGVPSVLYSSAGFPDALSKNPCSMRLPTTIRPNPSPQQEFSHLEQWLLSLLSSPPSHDLQDFLSTQQ